MFIIAIPPPQGEVNQHPVGEVTVFIMVVVGAVSLIRHQQWEEDRRTCFLITTITNNITIVNKIHNMLHQILLLLEVEVCVDKLM